MNNVLAIPRVAAVTFDEFWKQYPRRIGKPLARAKWEAITNGGFQTRTLDKDSGQYVDIELHAEPAEIIEGAKRYALRNRKKGTGEYGYVDDGRYLCHPATWLNQGRWEDEI